eukprot:TRINITY_DN55972_c0_g1_i1.p2 TRINITY_DN55972_c0_g1~~TRINITY_DN55972_c0_g1_i1.p2  ORF type:complete len:417 (+),score=160.45 TRINITY_DN55972_c0_g1_i1:68-1252(+)
MLAALACAAAAAAGAARPMLPVAVCDAETAYDCGRQVGRQMRALIAKRIQQQNVADLVAWAASDGQSALRGLANASRSMFPLVFDELRGLAEGAGQPLDSVLTLNLMQELAALRPMDDAARRLLQKGCTDLHVISSSAAAMGHNEDWTLAIDGYITVGRVNQTRSEFLAFTYPGTLPGWAWGFNVHGVGMTSNTLWPFNGTVGAGIFFPARAALDAPSVDAAAAVLTVPGQAQGESINLGSTADPARQLNIEVYPSGSDTLELRGGGAYYFHTNVYRHSPGKGPGNDTSSLHRLRRLEQLPPAATTADIRAYLSDTGDRQYPIYRNQTAPDHGATLNAVVLDYLQEQASVWVYWAGAGQSYAYAQSATAAQPTLTFPLRGGFDAWLAAARRPPQ